MNPIEDLLNRMIAGMLPQINGAIQQNIRYNNLDPWGKAAHGSECIGSINIGICEASVGANYNVGAMRGLSSITINSITVSNTQDDPNDPAKLVGNINVSASMSQNLNARLWGNVEAKCAFLHPSVSLGGVATVSGLSASATGFFSAFQTPDSVCLGSVSMSNMNVDYSDISVDVDSLGIFSFLLDPLVNVIVGAFKGQITGAIASALKPAVNGEVNKLLPQCQKI